MPYHQFWQSTVSIEATHPRWRLSAWLAVSEIQFLSNFRLVPRGRRALQWAQVRISRLQILTGAVSLKTSQVRPRASGQHLLWSWRALRRLHSPGESLSICCQLSIFPSLHAFFFFFVLFSIFVKFSLSRWTSTRAPDLLLLGNKLENKLSALFSSLLHSPGWGKPKNNRY